MPKATSIGFPVIGFVFLLLALFKFLNGGNWIVWVILGIAFGGLGAFTARRAGKGADQ